MKELWKALDEAGKNKYNEMAREEIELLFSKSNIRPSEVCVFPINYIATQCHTHE
jgi:hypothetical protein